VTATQPAWTPAVEEAVDVVTPSMAAGLHGLLDAGGPPPGDGDRLPPLWHWLAFLPRVAQRELGDDGHPRTGRFLPPVQGRRMFAGGRLTFTGPLPVGRPLHRRSTVASTEEKAGRSGRLVFVTVAHDIGSGHGDLAVSETQDLVYRPVPPPGGTTGAGSASGAEADIDPDAGWDWAFDLVPDAPLLFRFSALTYNAHRIHYDRPYATGVEGYPGLVVHGPLQAVALAELCRRHLPDRALATFGFRALRPAFDGNRLRLRGRITGAGAVTLTAFDHHGQPTMQAEATLQP
jgi:3-methylfumaryl-CoA hydratase